MPPFRHVSTVCVSQALGVSVSTVKRWVDEGVLPAQRTPGGHRKILVEDVLRLVKQNQLPHVDLEVLGIDRRRVAAEPPDLAEQLPQLIDALEKGEADRVRLLLLGAHDAHWPIENIADRLVAPALRVVGEHWQSGRLDVYHEHRGTLLCLASLHELKARLPPSSDPDAPLAVGGCPEGDPYAISSLLAEMILLENGWRPVNLGPHTPLASCSRAIREMKPRLFWLSVTHLADVDRFLEEYRRFYAEAESLGVAVAVGGQALTDPVRRRMPYTTYGDQLAQLAAFARSLYPRLRLPRRGRPPSPQHSRAAGERE